MMQQYNAESSGMGDNFGGAATSSLEDSTPVLSSAQDQFDNFNFAQASNDLFDSPQDLNRRTLTQEQFNTMQQTGLQLSETGDFNLDMDSDVFSKMFPDYSQQDTKSQNAFDFPDLPVPAPPGSAEQLSMGFPSSGAMQSRSVATSSEDSASAVHDRDREGQNDSVVLEGSTNSRRPAHRRRAAAKPLRYRQSRTARFRADASLDPRFQPGGDIARHAFLAEIGEQVVIMAVVQFQRLIR